MEFAAADCSLSSAAGSGTTWAEPLNSVVVDCSLVAQALTAGPSGTVVEPAAAPAVELAAVVLAATAVWSAGKAQRLCH